MRLHAMMNPKCFLLTSLTACVLLTQCNLFNRDARPQPVGLQQAQRYDPISRTWVALNTPTVRSAFVPPQSLAPEKAGETAKVLPSLSSEPAAPSTSVPGFLKRMGRAATSPLRAVGIGDGQ
jgi:hypothetical protein